MNKRREKQKAQNTLNSQLTTSDNRKENKQTNKVASKLGDFCFDVAKLIIGGVLLAGLMKQEINYWPLALSGFLAVTIFIICGIFFIRKSQKQ
ncbi:MAG: hypothetical protein IIZ97_00800 [Prevotella sp.]|nr:hypothetical protein [Prevotella sp.]